MFSVNGSKKGRNTSEWNIFDTIQFNMIYKKILVRTKKKKYNAIVNRNLRPLVRKKLEEQEYSIHYLFKRYYICFSK